MKKEYHVFPCCKVLGEMERDPSRAVIKYWCEVCGEKTYQQPIIGGEPEEDYYQCLECGEIYNWADNEHIPDKRHPENDPD